LKSTAGLRVATARPLRAVIIVAPVSLVVETLPATTGSGWGVG
jgi:hypothetical protein